jgi:hypothetical protein
MRHLEDLRDLATPLVEEAVESPELTDALRAGEPSYEAVVLVPLRSAERLLGLGLLYYDLHAVLPSRETLAHLGFLARELAGPLEASAAREAASEVDRLRVLSRTSEAAVASLLARLPSELARQQNLDLADVLAPLKGSGVTVELPSEGIPVLGDAPLIRFALASLVHLCETEACERGQVPEITVQAGREGSKACVGVSSTSRAPFLTPGHAGPDLSEAELNVVQAVVAAHEGELVQGRDADERLHFTVRLNAATINGTPPC